MELLEISLKMLDSFSAYVSGWQETCKFSRHFGSFNKKGRFESVAFETFTVQNNINCLVL